MNPVTEEGSEKNLFSRKMTAIWKHPLFQSSFQRIQEWEKDRIYCRHGMEHFLDTARIAYIRSLEDRLYPVPGRKYPGLKRPDLCGRPSA